MAGLFSSGEQDLLGNIMTQRQQANQALGSGYGKYGGIVQAAGGLIDTGTDAMFGGKVGAADPRMQQMGKVKELFSKAAMEVGNTTTPAFYERLAQELQAGGYPEQAQKAADKAMEIKKQGYEMSDLERKQNLQKAMSAIPVDARLEVRQKAMNDAIRQFGSPAEQLALAKEEAAKAKEAKAINSRATALVSTLGDKVDNETVLSIAGDPELYRKIMDDRLKIRDQKTKVITTKGGVWLVEDPSGKKIKYYGLPTSGVTIQNRQESSESSERGKLLVAQFRDVSEQASVSAKTRGVLQTNLNILEKGFDTGFGTETKAAAASVLASLGLEDASKYAANAQMFNATVNQIVLQAQLAQKGPQTEADARRITDTTAKLGNEKEANKFILKVAIAQANKDIKQRDFYAKWHKQYDTYDGAEDAWYEGEGGESLFDRPELKEYAQGVKSKVDQIPTATGTPESAAPATVAPIYATNGKQRIVSTDGGKTWQEVR